MKIPTPAIATQAGARRFPRYALLLLCGIYVFSGFIGRDGWKSADMVALGIMSDDSSAQVMLHIGIDTVKLEGKGFHALVAQGDHVDAGQPLVEVDFDAVRAAGFDPTVFVIVCERSENSTLREHASGPVAVKEPVVWLSE